MILNRQELHPEVDPNHVATEPIPIDIESVRESIFAPEKMFQFVVQRASTGQGQRRNKANRADCSCGRNVAVRGTVDCTVGTVSLWTITGIKPPEPLAIGLHIER